MSHDIQRQLDTATAFFLAGERCSPIVKFGPYDFHSVGAPTITNYALSVEVALKAIYVIATGTAARGHDLRMLVEDLPAEVRENLPHLAECAGEIARYFEDWRYPYEKDFLVGGEQDVRRAFIECYREIRRLRPSLQSFYEHMWGEFEPDWLGSEITSMEVRALVLDGS